MKKKIPLMKELMKEHLALWGISNPKAAGSLNKKLNEDSRMAGLINRRKLKEFNGWAEGIIVDLLDEGFEVDQIVDFLIEEVYKIGKRHK